MLTVEYSLLDIRPGERVLDVGCGQGRHASQACKEAACTVYALDIDRQNAARTHSLLCLIEDASQARARWLVLQADTLHLPFPGDYFDKIICCEVLEHLTDDSRALQELRRVLKPGGTLAVSVPTFLSEAIYWRISPAYHHRPGGHVRKYRARQLTSLLRRHGLRVFAVRRRHALHFFYWLLRCLAGIDREQAWLPRLYHRFLVWDIEHGWRPVRLLERLLDPVLGKSVVMYARKVEATGA